MYINSGYRNHSLLNFKDKSRPLIVGSCGTYRLSTHPKLPTYRPRGRLDFQIIYVASGRAHFHFDNPDNDTIIDAGNMVLFRPREFQKYEYYGIDKTEVYWIHFTGSDVKNILRRYGFSDDQRVFPVGISLEYERIFKKIILELQRCQDDYEEMLTMLLRYLLIVSWFIRNFKRYTGATPMQFITSIRITNAQMLLETTNYAVNEISRIVGYDNPLYFSRLFRKYKGCSPSKYRKRGE